MSYRSATKADIRALKSKLYLVIALFVCFLVAVIVWADTLAWFHTSKSVTGRGRTVTLEVSSNIIISDDLSLLQSSSWSQLNDGHPAYVVFDNERGKVVPATHASFTDSPTGLVFSRNGDEIDPNTGLVWDDPTDEPTLLSVPIYTGKAGEKRFYYEHKVYIASIGKNLNVSSFNVSLVRPTGTDLPDTFYAASVDFYVGEDAPSDTNYMGTLNIAGKNPDNSGDELLTLPVTLNGSPIETIPANTEGYITVTLRYYFDGALEKTKGSVAYVRTSNVTLSPLTSFRVLFTANE